MKKTIILGFATLFFVAVLGLVNPSKVNAKMSIPEDALEYNGHYYYYYEDVLSWTDAKEACEKLGGHLVTFSDKAEEDAIWEYIADKANPAWIGLYNDGAIDKVFLTVDDDWKWVTGEKVKYTNWAINNPDHMHHFIQDTFDMYAAIGKGEEVTAEGYEEFSPTPSWGDFDDQYTLSLGSVKGYVCEWDIYEIEVVKKSISLKKGKKYTIEYKIYDAAGHVEVKKAKATFKSSKKKIAKVTKKGKVTAVKKGSCKITLTYKDCTTKVKVKVK